MATMTAPVGAPPVAVTPPPPGPEPKSKIRGGRKAAILLTALGDEACAGVLRAMNEDEVHDATREISRLGDVSDAERKSVLEEFGEAHARGQLFQTGGIEYATQVLVAAFGPETGKRMAERVIQSLGMEMASLDSLQKADPQSLAKVIHRELPQTIALILSHVGPSQAAKLLTALPPDVRPEVALRMASLDQISPEVVGRIARTIGAKLRSLGEASFESYGGIRSVAEVLNRVDTATADSILTHITDNEPQLGTTIKNLMFVFEDLLHVDQEAIKTLLAKVDRKTLTTALKGTSAQLRDHFTSNMSTRAGEMLREDMDAMGPVRIRDVEEAQQQIVTVARQLEAEGAFSLKPSTGDQYVV